MNNAQDAIDTIQEPSIKENEMNNTTTSNIETSPKESETKQLTSKQLREARKHEKIVDNGQLSYVEIGLALKTIRDKRLYIGTFREYAATRFDLKYSDCCRLIRAAEVAKNLQLSGLPIPKNIGQAHTLHDGLEPSEQVEVWQAVLATKEKPTAALIEKTRDSLFGKASLADDVSNESIVGAVDLASAHSLPATPCVVLAGLGKANQELEQVCEHLASADSEGIKGLEKQLDHLESLIRSIREKAGFLVVAA